MKKWSRAFEQWMAELEENSSPNMSKQARLAWGRLTRQCGKMPWDIRSEDIEAHIQQMEAEGYKKNYIYTEVKMISRFYDWCCAGKVDEASGTDFNPARGVSYNNEAPFGEAMIWSREELDGLLELVERDASVLGKRELAYLRLRLSSGVMNNDIRELKWEQIEVDGEQAAVRWREGGEPVPMEERTWQAIREWLKASGRLEGMSAGKYIFTPLRYPEREETGNQADDWVEDKAITSKVMLGILKIYGSRLKIDKKKLTWAALRMTAIRLRLEAGEDAEGMRAFMQCRIKKEDIKWRMGMLPPLARDEGTVRQGAEVPVRHANNYKPGEGEIHGFYSQHKDLQAIKAVMDEDLRGLDQEINGLRRLMKGLTERDLDGVGAVETYSMAAARLSELSGAKMALGQSKEDSWVQEWLDDWDEIAKSKGWMTSEDIKADAATWDPEGLHTDLGEEGATLRMMLRKIERRAGVCRDNNEYLRLVDMYGKLCMRLRKVIRLEAAKPSRVGQYINYAIDEAIRQAFEELTQGSDSADEE